MFKAIACLGLLVPCMLQAQLPTRNHQRTAGPAEARFELMQSEFGARFTIRVDRFAGQTSQLVIQEDSTLTWQDMPRLPHPLPDNQVAGRANYQVFSSGSGVRYTFIINVNTGATWQLSEDPLAGTFWAPRHTKPKRVP